MNKTEKIIEKIIGYINNTLAKKEMTEVKKMIKTNSEWRDLYNTLKVVKSESLPHEFQDMAVSLKELSIRMFRENFGKSDGKTTIGLPVYDSDLMPLPDGIRRADIGTRQLKFKFDNMDVELSLYPVSLKSYRLIGQVKGGLENGLVKLKGIHEFGEKLDCSNIFIFPQVPLDNYRLKIYDGRKLLGELTLEL